jgi:uncharacterized repeat protein (TIGR02543 family)
LKRSTTFGVALVLLLLFSYFLVSVNLPEVEALVLLNDDFANLNNFTVSDGVWTTSGGVLQGTTGNGWEALIWGGDLSWINYQVTANVRTVSSDNEASLVVRYTTSGNFYWLGLGLWGHKYSISRAVDGVYTELASSGASSEVQVGKWYTVTAVAVSGTLQLFVDGIKVLEANDYSHPNGAIGFRTTTGTMEATQMVAQSLGWSRTYGGTNNDYGYSVVQTIDGGYATAGFTYSFGAGDADIYFVRTDSSGNILWSKTYGGTKYDVAFSVVKTFDGGYAIAGYTTSYGHGNSDVYLVKTDSNGNMQWSNTYGGTVEDYGNYLIQTSDGGYAIVGYTGSYGTGGSYDCYFVKTDSNGNMQWNKTYGGLDHDYGFSVIQTANGGYVIAGRTGSYGGSYGDAFLVKTDSNGLQLWQKTYGGSGNDYGYSVIQSSDGGYTMAGFTNTFGAGGLDVYLVKTDSNGLQLWQKTYGGSGNDYGNYLIQSSDGGYAIAGYTGSFGAGGNDAYLVKTDSSGNNLWSKTYGGTSEDEGYSVVQCSDSGYAIAGYTSSFGAANLDFYLIKTDSGGNITPTSYSITIGLDSAADAGGCRVRIDGVNYQNGDHLSYVSGSVVTITPSAASGWTFTGWTGDLSGSANPAQITMTGDKAVTATFTQNPPAQYNLTVYSAHGNPTPAVGTHAFNSGILVNCLIVSPVTEGNTVWNCTGWTGTGSVASSGTSTSTTFSISQNSSITWQWVPTSSDLVSLPSAYYTQPPYHLATSSAETHGTLDSVSQQTVTSTPGQLISFNISYQIYAPVNPNEIVQLFFVESWTPSWPPTGYTISVYNSIPGTPTGQTNSQTITFNAPSSPGTYYLWLCYDSQYSMQNAINYRTVSMAGLPAQIKVIVSQPQSTLNVNSAHGTPSPTVGSHSYVSGSSVTCNVISRVTEDGVTYRCTGWTGSGSVPLSGSDTSATFLITTDSTITWNWAVVPPSQCSLTVYSAHGTPSPAVGEHSYSSGSTITCSVASSVVEDGVNYTCTGWTGTGSVTSSGFGTSITLSITQDSSITWIWSSPLVVSSPVFNILSGNYSTVQSVNISCPTAGAVIRYTTDGSTPSSLSTVYSGPILVKDGTATIKAKAFKSGMTDSDIAIATYTIVPSPTPAPPPSPPWDIVATVIAVISIVIAVSFQVTRLRVQVTGRKRFVPTIDDPSADIAVATEIGNMQKKLEVFKAKYPDLKRIKPATSTNELFARTRINIDET